MGDTEIGVLQKYYGNHIREHAARPDTDPHKLEAMHDGCWSVFYHSISTDSNPHHHCCPKGETSWCTYQKALAKGEEPPPAHTTIPADFEEYLEPVWRSLCNPSLLGKCLLGATQNRNESFNGSGALRLSTQLQLQCRTRSTRLSSCSTAARNPGRLSWTRFASRLAHSAVPTWPLKMLFVSRGQRSRRM